MSERNEKELERIRLRCVCGEDGCWLWSGSMNGRGLPTLARMVDGKKRTMSARRWVYLSTGKTLKPTDQVIASCEVEDCVSPAHMRKTTRAAIQRANHRKDPGLRLRRGIAIKAAWNRKGGGMKLTQEQADYARTSTGPAEPVAQELGVSAAMVRYIRAGKAWRLSPSNPFAGLMASNDTNRRAA